MRNKRWGTNSVGRTEEAWRSISKLMKFHKRNGKHTKMGGREGGSWTLEEEWRACSIPDKIKRKCCSTPPKNSTTHANETQVVFLAVLLLPPTWLHLALATCFVSILPYWGGLQENSTKRSSCSKMAGYMTCRFSGPTQMACSREGTGETNTAHIHREMTRCLI